MISKSSYVGSAIIQLVQRFRDAAGGTFIAQITDATLHGTFLEDTTMGLRCNESAVGNVFELLAFASAKVVFGSAVWVLQVHLMDA